MSVIFSFSDQYKFLSNFYLSTIKIDEIDYPSVENYFQAMKCDNPKMFNRIRTAPPSKAKALGRTVPMVEDWDQIKVWHMKMGVTEKFKQNKELLKLLKGTDKKYLIEGNHWCDNFWGACWCNNCRTRDHVNMLGKILMKVRREL